MSDIRGKTADPDINSCENPIYAFSNKGIAQLLPKIMESAITYNKENKRFEFAVDPGNFRRRDSIRGSQSSSTVTSPTRTNSAESSQLQSPLDSPTPPEPPRTPPEQTGRRFFESRGDSDSGLGDSPPQPKDSVAHSPSGVPRSLFEQPQAQRSPMQSRGEGLERPPRQGSEREGGKGGLFQVVLEEIDPSQSTCDQSQLSLGAYESMLIEIRGQQVRYRPPSIPFPTAWDDSIFLNLGVSEDSPKDTENICNEGHKEQKVIGKSDQKSRDECSEPKSKESESPEKHGGGLFCKKGMPILAKLSPFKRRSVERDTMCSSKSDLVYHVTEKSSVSKPFFSFPTRIKAKSNPPSEVTSPTHEGGSEWQQRLDPDQREELCKVLSPEMKEKLNSGFFLPRYEKLLHLLYVDSETLRSLLSTSERAEQVCSVLPPEKGKQLHSDLPFKTKKGLLFKFFDDEQEISRNVSTSSADSGCYSGSSSQKSTSDTGSDKDKLEASGGFSQSGRLSVSSSPSSKSVSSVIKKVRVGSLFSLEAGK